MSESETEYSWDGLAEELKKALIGFMDMNDLAESSFAGVTAQLQLFGITVMARSAAIIDMARNGLLDLPTTNKNMSDKKTSLFHDFPEELLITTIMCTVK